MEQTEIEKPFNINELNKELSKSSKYLHFEPGEKKTLVVSTPINVETTKFGDKKIILRMNVHYINGDSCEPIKTWDMTNKGLIEQMLKILVIAKTNYNLIVQRGPGQNKATSYIVGEMS